VIAGRPRAASGLIVGRPRADRGPTTGRLLHPGSRLGL